MFSLKIYAEISKMAFVYTCTAWNCMQLWIVTSTIFKPSRCDKKSSGFFYLLWVANGNQLICIPQESLLIVNMIEIFFATNPNFVKFLLLLFQFDKFSQNLREAEFEKNQDNKSQYNYIQALKALKSTKLNWYIAFTGSIGNSSSHL